MTVLGRRGWCTPLCPTPSSPLGSPRTSAAGSWTSAELWTESGSRRPCAADGRSCAGWRRSPILWWPRRFARRIDKAAAGNGRGVRGAAAVRGGLRGSVRSGRDHRGWPGESTPALDPPFRSRTVLRTREARRLPASEGWRGATSSSSTTETEKTCGSSYAERTNSPTACSRRIGERGTSNVGGQDGRIRKPAAAQPETPTRAVCGVWHGPGGHRYSSGLHRERTDGGAGRLGQDLPHPLPGRRSRGSRSSTASTHTWSRRW